MSATVGPGAFGEVALGERAERRLVLERRLARDRVRVAARTEVVVAAELEARDAVGREAVEVLAVEREVEDGHAVGLEDLGTRRLQPRERLAHAANHPGRQPRDVLRPRACGEHEPLGLDGSTIGADAHAVLRLRPLEHALARSQHCASCERALDVRDDAAFGDDEAAVRLVRDLHVRRQSRRPGSAARPRRRSSTSCSRSCSAHERSTPSRIRSPPSTIPVILEELLACFGLELAPQLVRAAQKRHVVRVLEVREADDAREPVRRALLVEQVEALEPEHALAAAGEVVERSAPHSADSDDDDVVPLHRA